MVMALVLPARTSRWKSPGPENGPLPTEYSAKAR